MPVSTDNLNLNLNLNLGGSPAGGSGGVTGYGRPRFNTEDMNKLLPGDPNLALPGKTYDPNWDPELRAWAYVEEFCRADIWGGSSPITWLANKINTYPTANTNPSDANFPVFPVPNLMSVGPISAMSADHLKQQVRGVAEVALDRADRFTEILDQATGAGALNYWTGLLRIDPVQERNVFMLMIVARKIGEYVAMGLKDVYRMRRPSQVFPLLLPLIDPPDTPSFPSSHSLQAHLISYALLDAIPVAKVPNAFTSWPNAGNYPTAAALLSLADRVAKNREIAGVHYAMDSACGAYAAYWCWQQIKIGVTRPNNGGPPKMPKYADLLGNYQVVQNGNVTQAATMARLDLLDMP